MGLKIEPAMSVQVISSYTRINSNANTDVISNIKHIDNNGIRRIEQVEHIKYNKTGELVRSQPHASVDIII